MSLHDINCFSLSTTNSNLPRPTHPHKIQIMCVKSYKNSWLTVESGGEIEFDENSDEYTVMYVYCFAHQLQLAIVYVALRNDMIGDFF